MAVPDAVALVELALQATTAYRRSDLTQRLRETRNRLADPAVRVLVVGEFKQGKSQLVNALVSAQVCPVDDDIATAVPTVVRYAEQASAALVRELAGDDAGLSRPAQRTEIPLNKIAEYVTEAGSGDARQVRYVEVGLPRQILADGLVLIDTPGVGGLGSAHAAATMASLAGADAVLLVSDAAQEYTKAELDFLAAAMRLCPNVAGVLSKTDLYPHWRRIAEIDRGHLAAAGVSAPLFELSSSLRLEALRVKDTELNVESGFPAVVSYLQERIVAQADDLDRRNTRHDILNICDQLSTRMNAELVAQETPEKVEQLVAELERAKARAATLKERSSRWQLTLNDNVADLSADIDHDLRDRMRRILRDAEELADDGDPADVWDQYAAWLHKEVAGAASTNFMWASERASWIADQVAEHFASEGATVLPELHVLPDAGGFTPRVTTPERPEMEKATIGERALSVWRGGYMGGLMIYLPVNLVVAGLAITVPYLAPVVAGGAAVMMGRKAARDDKQRGLARRQAEAKAAARKHIDEVTFQVSKDSRDMLRRTQRILRDHFSGIAEELHTSISESVTAAQGSLRGTEAERAKRISDLKAELERVEMLAGRARQLALTS